tara:strand:+ start:3404 stop:3907 length:504 start_codon:yes stop_codon:yes gene_type:complete
MKDNTKILNSYEIGLKINRLAWEIYEDNLTKKNIILIGISGRGEKLAKKIYDTLTKISSINIQLGTIELNKDVPFKYPISVTPSNIQYTDEKVILVDDVLNSGKTLIYACKYFLNTSLHSLSTVVLVERTHNRFPIKANFVGLSLATTLQEYIKVVLEGDGQGVYLC